MVTNQEYLLLSAWANAPATSATLGGAGQPIKNFITASSANILEGWVPQEITLNAIQNVVDASRPATEQGYNLLPANLSGMSALVFTKGTETIIAFRGTQFDDLDWTETAKDIATDLAFGVGAIPQQVHAAYYFTKTIMENFSSSHITLTGHSLGGGLAGIISTYTGLDAVVFDPAPTVDTAVNFATDGTNGVYLYQNEANQISIWPKIPPSSNAPGDVTRIVSQGDPLYNVLSNVGGGMIGVAEVYHLNYDEDVFAHFSLYCAYAGC